MKQIVVISGKGGTGKTSLVAALAHLGAPLVLADCDVDATNLHLLCGVDDGNSQSEDFISGSYAQVAADSCTGCRACLERCRFDAITESSQPDGRFLPFIDPVTCEGCGVCVDNCPAEAIAEVPRLAGHLITGESRFGTLVYGRLDAGQPNSGKLVSLVRQRARETAEKQGCDLVLVDGSPGVGCPVIASLTGVDLALLVVEPTTSSQHDMQRVLDLCRHFNIPAAVVINKLGLNPDVAKQVAESCSADGIPVLGRIDYDEGFVRALVAGRTITEAAPDCNAAAQVCAIWSELQAVAVK